jgi:hypothetical protein
MPVFSLYTPTTYHLKPYYALIPKQALLLFERWLAALTCSAQEKLKLIRSIAFRSASGQNKLYHIALITLLGYK